MIKIVTDTTCDIPAAWEAQFGITRLPINIQFGLETFLDRQTITPETFYQRIESDQTLPTTAQPSVGQFCEAYTRLAGDGAEILSIHVTSKLSGTWQTACLAAKQVQDQVQVTVVDSLMGSTGLGLLVREAAQLAQKGWPMAKIVPHLEARRPQILAMFMLHDLRHARMSGRVGRIRETLVSLLNIKPIVGVDRGALIPLDRVRTQRKGLEHMVNLAIGKLADTPVHVGVVHALAPTAAEDLLGQLQHQLNCQDTFVCELALSLAVHFGPGTVGFTTYPAE